MNLVLCYFTFFLPFWPFMNLFFFFSFLSFWLSCFICIKINWTNSRLRTPWGKYPTDLINHKVAESPPAPLCCNLLPHQLGIINRVFRWSRSNLARSAGKAGKERSLAVPWLCAARVSLRKSHWHLLLRAPHTDAFLTQSRRAFYQKRCVSA